MLNPHNDLLQKGLLKDSESEAFFTEIVSENQTVAVLDTGLLANSILCKVYGNYLKEYP